jgi:hypothetical protein
VHLYSFISSFLQIILALQAVRIQSLNAEDDKYRFEKRLARAIIGCFPSFIQKAEYGY